MMSKNSIVPFLKDYLIKFLTRPFLLDTNDPVYYSNISSGMTDILGYTLYAKLFHLSTSIRHTIISCHQKPSRTAEIGNTLQDMPIRKI